MYNVTEKEDITIQNMIHEINGIQVMLDSDLAALYACKNGTKEINQAVKNNPEKFPERFSWILSHDEWANLRSKILTSFIILDIKDYMAVKQPDKSQKKRLKIS